MSGERWRLEIREGGISAYSRGRPGTLHLNNDGGVVSVGGPLEPAGGIGHLPIAFSPSAHATERNDSREEYFDCVDGVSVRGSYCGLAEAELRLGQKLRCEVFPSTEEEGTWEVWVRVAEVWGACDALCRAVCF